MKTLLFKLIHDIWNKFQLKATMLIVLMVCSSTMDGIGMALLFPFVSMVSVKEKIEHNYISDSLIHFLSYFGIEFNVKNLILIIIFVFLIQNLILLFQSYLSAKLQNDYVYLWRKNLFCSYFNASWYFFVRNKIGDLTNLIISETNRLGGSFYLLFTLLSAFIISIVYISISFLASWEITLIVVMSGLIIFFLTRKLVRKGYEIGKKISSYNSDFESSVQEFLSGAKIIKATSTEKLAQNSFLSIAENLKKTGFLSSFLPNVLKICFEFPSIILLCILLYLSINYFSINPAVTIVIIAIFIRLIPRLFSVQQNLQLLGIYLPAISYISKALHEAESFVEKIEHNKQTRLFKGSVEVEIKNLTVFYGEKKVIDNVSINIPKGKLIGIVGGSGSGKSTLVDCIIGLIKPDDGSINIEGTSISQISLNEWRKCIGYVAQDTFLFNDSIRNNIVWGTDFSNEDDIIEAAKKSNAHEFIIQMPKGFETKVGDRGICLSGGQRQRIGLARALINRPSLLILDEATSNLDAESENEVLKAITQIKGEMTVIIVSHRLATVKNADIIYVIESGKIVEFGNWDYLVEKKGRFKQLLDIQSA